VPVAAQGRVLGVLSLYDREDGEPFTLGDAEALTAFAVQAAVAIENVQLHAEAERLSVTDPLTGAWNYRYFERRFEQEIERSRRFGHQRGGEEFVLILPETNLEGGLAVSEKLRLATHKTPFCGKGEDGGMRLTVSIGVAASPSTPPSPRSYCGPPTRHPMRPSCRGGTGWSPPGRACCR
jgi:two-component system, cell cycle response regulator